MVEPRPKRPLSRDARITRAEHANLRNNGASCNSTTMLATLAGRNINAFNKFWRRTEPCAKDKRVALPKAAAHYCRGSCAVAVVADRCSCNTAARPDACRVMVVMEVVS